MRNQHDCHLLTEKSCYSTEKSGKEFPYGREKTQNSFHKPFFSSFVMMNRGQLFLLKCFVKYLLTIFNIPCYYIFNNIKKTIRKTI